MQLPSKQNFNILYSQFIKYPHSLSINFHNRQLHYIIVLFCISFFITPVSADNVFQFFRPLPALSANDLGVIVNDLDPLSVKIAQYYQQQRKIPEKNIIHIKLHSKSRTLAASEFKKIKQQVDEQTPKNIQAYALTWVQPYRVDCMSITTAFAAGFDRSFCAKGCNKTRHSPYFNSEENDPFTTFKWRPTMALAGKNFKQVKALIDRGIASDFSLPQASAYLLETSDKARSTRAIYYPAITKTFNNLWPVNILQQDYIENKKDVMFYFTGMTSIEKIQTNVFLPGAVADHLTSKGGMLTGSTQMSSLRWLEAGATGSYGAVIEPCNFVQKFPNPGIMMHYYIRGNTLIEAYWKSVSWPGQGIFIGEPLAKPFASR